MAKAALCRSGNAQGRLTNNLRALHTRRAPRVPRGPRWGAAPSRRPGVDKSYTTTTPALLAEVLSPSSEAIDLGDKAAEYLELPSLLAYIVLPQDARKAWMWLRASTAAPFAPGPKVISEAVIPIAGLQLELPMADMYAGTEID